MNNYKISIEEPTGQRLTMELASHSLSDAAEICIKHYSESLGVRFGDIEILSIDKLD